MPKFADLFPGLIAVRSTNVDDGMFEGLIEHLGSAEQAQDRDLRLLGRRNVAFRRRRSDQKTQGENPLLHQALEAGPSAAGIKAVVKGQQLHLPAVDAAVIVDRVEAGCRAKHCLAAQNTYRAVKCGSRKQSGWRHR
jgi:hypothetical protein